MADDRIAKREPLDIAMGRALELEGLLRRASLLCREPPLPTGLVRASLAPLLCDCDLLNDQVLNALKSEKAAKEGA